MPSARAGTRPFLQHAYTPLHRRGHGLQITIFLLSVPRFACLDMMLTSLFRLATSPLEDTPDVAQPSQGPLASGTNPRCFTESARVPLGSMGLVVRLTITPPNGRKTTAPDHPGRSPAPRAAELRVPKCLASPWLSFPGPWIVFCRWVASVALQQYCIIHPLSPLPSPTLASKMRCKFLSRGLVLESPSFELVASAVAAIRRQKLPGCPRN